MFSGRRGRRVRSRAGCLDRLHQESLRVAKGRPFHRPPLPRAWRSAGIDRHRRIEDAGKRQRERAPARLAIQSHRRRIGRAHRAPGDEPGERERRPPPRDAQRRPPPPAPRKAAACPATVPREQQRRVAQLRVRGARDHRPDRFEAAVRSNAARTRREAEPQRAACASRRRRRANSRRSTRRAMRCDAADAHERLRRRATRSRRPRRPSRAADR